MKAPCEMVVWYVIPTIRSELAKELFKLGMIQKEIAVLLDITQPAVSQYLSDKRGKELELNPEILVLIKNLARDLNQGKATTKDMVSRTCQICREIKSYDIICQIHKEKDNVPPNCSVCLDLDK